MRRGDIGIAAARGGCTGTPRPVVIVQDDRCGATASVTVCPLTTEHVEAPLTRIAIEPSAVTGIERPSQIMVDKIATMPRAGVRERLGRLADADLVRLNRRVDRVPRARGLAGLRRTWGLHVDGAGVPRDRRVGAACTDVQVCKDIKVGTELFVAARRSGGGVAC